MTEKVLQLLNTFGKMPPELNAHIGQILKKEFIPKGTEIVRDGEVSRKIFYLAKGMVVGLKWQKDQWVTTWIMRDGDIVTSPESFFTQTASNEQVIAAEDCEIWVITWEQLQEIYRLFPIFNLNGRLLTEKYYVQNLKLTDFMKRYTAKEKYSILLDTDEELTWRCPAKYLASYLNVNTTTLSTIKSEVMEERRNKGNSGTPGGDQRAAG
jgi:CRP/FNR family transcriptional regulator, anaerobic regulatory protein